MELFRSVKKIFEKEKNTETFPTVTAIVVAAGRSERMGLETGKQFLEICGVPVIARTLSAFELSRRISRVIVVARDIEIMAVADTIREFGFEKVEKIVRGGETRQQSAALGLTAAGQTDLIAVHDGARPLVTPLCIDRVVEAAYESKAAAAAVRLKDTIKVADENGIVLSTPDRSNLWAVQTPQVFETQLYIEAHRLAKEAGADYTDDCQLVEAMGRKVRLVEGEYTNLKITTQSDLTLAEAVLRARGEG